jgi:hypothetical protein
MARTPNFRRVVTLVCVAMALAVSAVDQWSVADTERAARAGVEVGAPVVLIVNTPSANAMLAATTAADPSGRYAMPVVVQTPEGGQTPLMAVGHQSLRSVADWGSDRHAPTTKTVAALGPANPPKPITVHGSDVRLRLNSVTLTPVGASGNPDPNAYIPPDQRANPISLRLYFRLRDGTLTSTTLALKTSSRPSVSSSFFGGCVHGCDLSRIEIQRAACDFSHVRIAVAINALEIGTTADGFTSVDLGRLSDWGNVNADKVAAGTADTIEFGDRVRPGPAVGQPRLVRPAAASRRAGGAALPGGRAPGPGAGGQERARHPWHRQQHGHPRPDRDSAVRTARRPGRDRRGPHSGHRGEHVRAEPQHRHGVPRRGRSQGKAGCAPPSRGTACGSPTADGRSRPGHARPGAPAWSIEWR